MSQARRTQILLILTAILGAGMARSGVGADAGGEGKALEWSVLPLLPSQTVAVVSIRDVQKAGARFQETGLWRLVQEKGVREALKNGLTMGQGALALAEQRLGKKPLDLLAMVQGEFTFALLGLLDARNEQGEPIPDVLLAFQPREQEKAWMDYWGTLVDKLNLQTENTLQIKQANVAGADVITVSHPAAPFQITYTMHEGVFLVALGPGRIENILAARQAAQAHPAEGAGAGEPTTLAALPAFQRAKERAGADAQALLFVNVAGLRKVPEFKFNPKTDREKLEWDMAGLSGIKAFSYSLGVKGSGLRETVFLEAPAAGRTGLLTLLDGPPLAADALARAPKNSLAAVAMQADPVTLLDRILGLTALGNPQAAAQINAVLLQAGKGLNLDFRKDLLGALNGQAVFSVSVPAHHPKVVFGFPRPVLTLGVKDAEKAKQALDAVRRVAQDSFELKDLPHGPYVITSARERNPGPDKDPALLCWVLTRERLHLSLFPLALRDELERLEGTGDTHAADGGALTEDPDFRSARAQMAGAPQALVYVDLGALATAAYDTFVPWGQIREKETRFVDLQALPAARLLAGHLSGTLLGLTAEAEGVRIESYSAMGLWTTVVPVVGFVAEKLKARRPVVAAAVSAVSEPALSPAMSAKRQLMQNLGRQLNAYARDHGGAFPATLNDLIPTYFKEDARARLTGITYLGKQSGPTRVLAYVAEAQEPLPVLLQEGAIRVIQPGQLEDALRDGFSGTKAKPWETGAAKPPLPPPDF